ncbi:Sporulation related domain protein [Roseovarius aestuarii]|uniref:Sporulation related domain protein n=2 Tax=Roseovarius aestuarii TaxID=475083 RepID=A0A1X7BSB8_9RHOB|nr:Sporulation related domain protein [Roseovarius aestuarii]
MIFYHRGRRTSWRNAALAGVGMLLLSGCEEGAKFNPFKQLGQKTETAEAATAEAGSSVKLIERDVEAPEVFQVTDQGLWDGRPSLGGVWVAHPDVKEPERVIIRNNDNSQFVIGALFRRERANPGPVLQVSSDAAAAIGMLAGAPASLNVTALRREQMPDPEAVPAPVEEPEEPAEVEVSSLDPVAGAAAALDEAEIAESASAAPEAAVEPAATSQVASPTPVSTLDKPFIQIGIFSVEQNADNTATAMRQAGMVPMVKEGTSQGKSFWRVIVGPASNKSERDILLKKIADSGFDDAYPVTN